MKSAETQSVPAAESVRFGKYVLDPARRRLTDSDGEPVAVTGRVFDTLLYLVHRRGELVTKRELLETVWGDTVVEENNLTQTISTLRRLLGERPDEHRYIVTVPGRGYRFVADTETVAPADVAKLPERTATRGGWRGSSVAALIGLALLLASLGVWRLANSPPSLPDPDAIDSIAVLPFRPLVPDVRDPVLELGMADTLITRLSATRGIVVRPLSSVRRYADVDQDPIAAGRELGVDAVLEGSIQRVDGAVRINTRLIRVNDGASLWSDKLDEPWAGVFALQDAIAEAVVDRLALGSNTTQRQHLARDPTISSEAYGLYLIGRYHWGRLTPSAIETAIDHFQRAIEIDSTYALAYAGLAEAYRSLPITSDVPPRDVLPDGKAAALRALEIDAELDQALATLCFIETWYDWDWSAAERTCRRALELNPYGADAHRAYAILLSDLGRHARAIEHAERARQLDPLSLLTNAIEGHVLHYAGRHEVAIERLTTTLSLSDDFWIAHLFLGKALFASGRPEHALASFERARELSGGNSETISLIGYTRATLGDIAGARAALEELESRAATAYVPPFNIALLHHGLGDRERTLEWLEKAVEDRDVRLTFLKIEPLWNPIRNDERFASLVRRMRLQ